MPINHHFRLAIALLFLVGCTAKIDSKKQCNSRAELKGNAGCLIYRDTKLLVILQNNNKLSIPGGRKEQNESASCTAWRETKEETGISINVKEYMGSWKNGFHVFRCVLQDEQYAHYYSPPWSPWGRGEVKEIQWRSFNEIADKDWRYSGQLSWIKTLLKN